MTESDPYLTADLPAAAGRFKARPEDFRVEEVPAYAAIGEGDHVFFEIEKTGMSTRDAVQRVARALGVQPRAIGYAGLKDSQAVTRQMLSVEHIEPSVVEALDLDRMRVVSAVRHRNKLRIGHLAGNRFAIRLRECDAQTEPRARAVLEVLARRGVPNYFGEQRFGVRGDSWRVGRALLLGEHAEAAAWIAGRPGPLDRGRVLQARELFEKGEFERAARAWPGNFRDCIRLCTAMAKKHGDAKRALHAVDLGLLRLTVSSYQAWLFNKVLARRVAELDRLMPGDLAWKHVNGSVFTVVELGVEQARADAFEISPSGPLFGRRTTLPSGQPLEIELAVLAGADHTLEDFQARGRALEWQGGRRPLRFPPSEWRAASGADEHGDFVELAFALPPGCYATSVLREILKSEVLENDSASKLDRDTDDD
jgi:tRNA pseudouridine13 synthase